jgi:hypothetical protein
MTNYFEDNGMSASPEMCLMRWRACYSNCRNKSSEEWQRMSLDFKRRKC